MKTIAFCAGWACVRADFLRCWLKAEHRQGGVEHRRVRLRVSRGERLDRHDAELHCRDVFDAAPRAVAYVGSALITQASASHRGAGKA